jgi:hypothetical protein
VLAIVDPNGQTEHVEELLPRRWATHRFANIYEIDRPDIIVLGGAAPPLVAATRLLYPDVSLIAVINREAPPLALAGLLHSGADVGVRDGALHILAAHVIACHRRRVRLAYARRRPVA